MTFCLYTAKSFYLKDTVASVVLITKCKQNTKAGADFTIAKTFTFRWVMNNYSKLLQGWHHLVEKWGWEKKNNFYASPQYTFSGLQRYFLSKKNPISHFSQPGFVCKLKRKGTKNISANTCPLSNQVQWLQKPRDGTWFVPCFSQ